MGPLPITGVAEIVLSVRDFPAMRRFYLEVMGFPIFKEECHEKESVSAPTGEPTISFLTIQPLDTPLGRHSHPQTLVLIDFHRHASSRPGHDATASTLHHLAFEIPAEYHQAHRDRLTGLKLNPIEVEFENISARALFFKDPDGNTIELICANRQD